MRRILLLSILCYTSLHTKAQVEVFPANMYLDTLHTPFLNGVASGDPMSDRVIIWTRLAPIESSEKLTGTWSIATDEAFINVVNSGDFVTSSDRDWTVKVDVSGLEADQVYFYRFEDEFGQASATGRTKTAPESNTEQLTFAITSCSSIYSGFFNAYRHIANRTDLDLFIHLGDYVYDFVDQDEQVRVPEPFPTQPETLEEWRNLHNYYLTDPDLRAARQQHPMAMIWDNHDVDRTNPSASTQAFLEWNPIRLPDTSDTDRIYKTLHYGDLADLILVDIWRYRNQDTLANGENSTLSNAQFEWLKNELTQSEAHWKIIGNQKLFANWSTENVPAGLPVDGAVFDADSWDGFPNERERVLNVIKENNVENIIIISGHLHVSIAADVPKDKDNYDPTTGEGSLAVEFLSPSVSRGNFDEAGFGLFTDLAIQLTLAQNPHHKYLNLTEHGYGILRIEPQVAHAQYWYTDILNPDSEEWLAKELKVFSGESHWRSSLLDISTFLPKGYEVSNVYPNPNDSNFAYINITLPQREQIQFVVFDTNGKVIQAFERQIAAGKHTEKIKLHSSSTVQWLLIKGERFIQAKPIVMNRK